MLGISVVMPTFNRAAFIDEALSSLVQQTAQPLEAIVVDDGSTDDTRDRVATHSFAHKIRFHRQARRQGASMARNTGVELARGNVIVFLDSDDLLDPSHHQRVLAAMHADPALGLFCCDARMIGPRGELLHEGRSWTTVQCGIKRMTMASGLRVLREIFQFSTPFPGMAVRRDVYRSVGGLDQDVFPLDDYDLQLKVAAAGHHVHYEHAPLASYRVHGSNESGPGREIVVGRQKLRCLERAVSRSACLADLARPRLAEVRRELAIAQLKARSFLGGAGSFARSLRDDPAGFRELAWLAGRKLRRLMG